MKRALTKILNIPGIIVEEVKETEEILILSVKVQKNTAFCPRCGQISHRLHQNKRHLVKDLPMANKEVVLNVNRRRFKCKNCQKPFSEKLDFVGNRKNFTHRYAESITHQIINSDVKNGLFRTQCAYSSQKPY